MTEFETVLSKLDHVKKTGKEYSARCPAHHDEHNSLSIKDDGGKAILHCFADCQYVDIAEKLNLPRNGHNGTPVEPKIVATYDYTGLKGQLLYQVVRYEPKAFKHRRPDGKGGWIWDLKGITPTLYRLSELIGGIATDATIFVVEGEKDVDNLRKHSLVATTISGGASSKWHPALIALFEGANVCVIPDNDTAGLKYAYTLANILSVVASEVKVPILTVGKDVSDYLETKSIQDLLELVQKTKPYLPHGVVTWDDLGPTLRYLKYLQRKTRSRYD